MNIEPTSNLIPHFKPDIKLNVEFNVSTINGIQTLYGFLLEGKGKDDADGLKSRIENKQALSAWDISIVTVTNLISTIQKLASDTSQLEYKSIEQTIQELEQSQP